MYWMGKGPILSSADQTWRVNEKKHCLFPWIGVAQHSVDFSTRAPTRCSVVRSFRLVLWQSLQIGFNDHSNAHCNSPLQKHGNEGSDLQQNYPPRTLSNPHNTNWQRKVNHKTNELKTHFQFFVVNFQNKLSYHLSVDLSDHKSLSK